MASIGILCDKDHQPTSQEICDVLGSAQPLWSDLTQFIADSYQMLGELNFGGKKYGWNVWYRRSGKTLVSLYAQQNNFVAQIVLGKEHLERASGLMFGENVKIVLETTPQLHDGRWLFIKVTTEKDVKDIGQLLQVKKRPKLLLQG